MSFYSWCINSVYMNDAHGAKQFRVSLWAWHIGENCIIKAKINRFKFPENVLFPHFMYMQLHMNEFGV